MKILLDENLPESLVNLLSEKGHEVDSVNSLQLKGIENGALYSEIATSYELFFTKDAGFAHNVSLMEPSGNVKLLHVVIPQQKANAFCQLFIDAFEKTDWNQLNHVVQWPESYSDRSED